MYSLNGAFTVITVLFFCMLHRSYSDAGYNGTFLLEPTPGQEEKAALLSHLLLYKECNILRSVGSLLLLLVCYCAFICNTIIYTQNKLIYKPLYTEISRLIDTKIWLRRNMMSPYSRKRLRVFWAVTLQSTRSQNTMRH